MTKKQLFLIFIILPLIVYGGAKAYLHHHIQQLADNLVTSVSPFVKVKYGDITTTWDGAARIERIDITVPQTDEVIRVAALELKTHNFYQLLTLGNAFEKQELPESLALAIKGVDLNLHSRYAEVFDEFVKKTEATNSKHTALPDLGCGDIKLTISGFEKDLALGYDNLLADTQFGYRHEKKGPLVFEFSTTVKDMFSFELNWALDVGDSSIMDNIRHHGAEPKLVRVSGSIVDHSYVGRLKKVCMEHNGGDMQKMLDGQMRYFTFLLTCQNKLAWSRIQICSPNIASFWTNPTN